MGSTIHGLLEELQQENITKEDAQKKFLDALDSTEILDYKFPTPNSKKNFKECNLLYFSNYNKIDADEFKIEEYFEVKVSHVMMRGYIDLYTINGKYIDIYDYKSSSKFSKKELEEKKIQLIIYGLALQEKYPELEVRNLYFDMCKYTKNERGTLKERNTVENQDKKGLVKVKFNEENIQKAKDFVKEIYESIKEKDPRIEKDWKPNVNIFFCENLCSNLDICPTAREKIGAKKHYGRTR